MVAYVINRTKDVERRQWVNAQMDALCLEYRFFPAMCPDGIKWGAVNSRVRGMRRQTAFGCYLSHMHVLKDALLNETGALIFEDDFLPMPAFAFDFKTLPEGYDAYFFGWITWGDTPTIKAINEDWHERSGFAGTHCYYVPKDRVAAIVRALDGDSMTLQYDHALTIMMREKKLRFAFKSGPRVIQQTDFPSTIGNAPHRSDIDFKNKFFTPQF